MKMKTFKIGDFITFGGAIVSDVRKIELHETLTASGGRRLNFDGSYYAADVPEPGGGDAVKGMMLGADFYMLLCYENLSGKMEQGLIPPKERLIEQPEPPLCRFGRNRLMPVTVTGSWLKTVWPFCSCRRRWIIRCGRCAPVLRRSPKRRNIFVRDWGCANFCSAGSKQQSVLQFAYHSARRTGTERVRIGALTAKIRSLCQKSLIFYALLTFKNTVSAKIDFKAVFLPVETKRVFISRIIR